MTPNRGPLERSHHRKGQSESGSSFKVLFSPDKSDVELFDDLAEKQAELMPSGKYAINANQLRKYFGEIKDLYRQFEALKLSQPAAESYLKSIEPRFKMIRSKVAYGKRAGGQAKLPREFADLISDGIGKVRNGQYLDFERFVMHLEAVVGFMYGKGKVS